MRAGFAYPYQFKQIFRHAQVLLGHPVGGAVVAAHNFSGAFVAAALQDQAANVIEAAPAEILQQAAQRGAAAAHAGGLLGIKLAHAFDAAQVGVLGSTGFKKFHTAGDEGLGHGRMLPAMVRCKRGGEIYRIQLHLKKKLIIVAQK